jgi:hypothetical protein
MISENCHNMSVIDVTFWKSHTGLRLSIEAVYLAKL